MDPFLSYIIIYLSFCVVGIPGYLYVAGRIAKKRLEKEPLDREVLFGYCFFPISPTSMSTPQAKRGKWDDIAPLAQCYADEFLDNIKNDFWVNLANHKDNTKQGCDEYFGYCVGITELCMVLEYEVHQYTQAMKVRHDDANVLKESAINEAVDVLLFITAYRSLEAQLNLLDRSRAMEIFEFCKDNLSFLDAKYTNILEMDPVVSGIRRQANQ